jgi:hypothetical protein
MWFLERWLENKKTVKKLVYVLYASLIISCLLGFAIHLVPPAEHIGHDEHGFIVCALLGLGSKAYGHNVVMKEEDYYDK